MIWCKGCHRDCASNVRRALPPLRLVPWALHEVDSVWYRPKDHGCIFHSQAMIMPVLFRIWWNREYTSTTPPEGLPTLIRRGWYAVSPIIVWCTFFHLELMFMWKFINTLLQLDGATNSASELLLICRLRWACRLLAGPFCTACLHRRSLVLRCELWWHHACAAVRWVMGSRWPLRWGCRCYLGHLIRWVLPSIILKAQNDIVMDQRCSDNFCFIMHVSEYQQIVVILACFRLTNIQCVHLPSKRQ